MAPDGVSVNILEQCDELDAAVPIFGVGEEVSSEGLYARIDNGAVTRYV